MSKGLSRASRFSVQLTAKRHRFRAISRWASCGKCAATGGKGSFANEFLCEHGSRRPSRTVFVIMTISIASEGLFHSENPEKPGFIIAAEEAAPAEDAAPAEAAVPIADLLAAADPPRARPCSRSAPPATTAKKGAANKVGPHLYGVVGRPIASLTDFGYSAPMKEFAEGGKQVWDFEHLNSSCLPRRSISRARRWALPASRGQRARRT